MHRDAAHVPADELHLADVDAGADAEPLFASDALDRLCAVECARRPIEGREHPVARRGHLAAAEPVELTPDRLEVVDEELAPGRVPHPGGGRCGVDEIREEEREERAALQAGVEPGERVQAGPSIWTQGSSPTVQPSWPGGLSITSFGPNSRIRPSCSWTATRPERTTPT